MMKIIGLVIILLTYVILLSCHIADAKQKYESKLVWFLTLMTASCFSVFIWAPIFCAIGLCIMNAIESDSPFTGLIPCAGILLGFTPLIIGGEIDFQPLDRKISKKKRDKTSETKKRP